MPRRFRSVESLPLESVFARTRFVGGTLLAVFLAGWALWFWPYDNLLDRNGTPLGADFAMFYVGGQLVADGEAALLYDQGHHQRRLQELFPEIARSFCLPYRYPPLVAGLLAPLSRLPYPVAFTIFSILSLGAFAFALLVLGTSFRLLQSPLRGQIWILAFTCPLVLETLIGGQASLFAFAVAASVIVALRKNRPTLAGALLAIAVCKPNVLAIFAIGCVTARPALLRGAVPVAILLALGSTFVGGPGLVTDYLQLATNLVGGSWDVETPFWKVHSLAGSLAHTFPMARLLCAVAGIGLALISGVRARHSVSGGSPEPAFFGQLLVWNVLLNPYTPIYDLTLLLLAVLCLAESAVSSSSLRNLHVHCLLPPHRLVHLQALLFFLFLGPHLSQSLAQPLNLQLFPLLATPFALQQLTRKVRKVQTGTASPPENALQNT